MEPEKCWFKGCDKKEINFGKEREAGQLSAGEKYLTWKNIDIWYLVVI